MTSYFTDRELACRCCGAQGCVPSAVEALNVLREAYGKPIVLTSAYRCRKHPAEASKEQPGQHNAGTAFDIRVKDGAEAYEIMELAFGLGWKGIALGNGFVHVDRRPGKPVTWRY